MDVAVICVWVHDVVQSQGSLLDFGTKWYLGENTDHFLSFQGMARLILMNL